MVLLSSIVVCLAGCSAASPVPALDPSNLDTPPIDWLEPKQVRLAVIDERFVSAEDKLRTSLHVASAVTTLLARTGIAVTPDSESELSLRFGEADRPIGRFATNECVVMNAVLRTSRSIEVRASGFGCALEGAFAGPRIDTSLAFESAINMVFGSLVRGTI